MGPYSYSRKASDALPIRLLVDGEDWQILDYFVERIDEAPLKVTCRQVFRTTCATSPIWRDFMRYHAVCSLDESYDASSFVMVSV